LKETENLSEDEDEQQQEDASTLESRGFEDAHFPLKVVL
jgi:hypothetical protein